MFNVIPTIENDLQWIGIDDVSNVLDLSVKTVKEQCWHGKLNHRIIRNGKKSEYLINFNSLPEYAQLKLQGLKNPETLRYSEAPVWAKSQADKYLDLFEVTENKFGKNLREYIADWNGKHPQNTTSYQSIMRMRKRYSEEGINGLLQ